MIRNSQPKIKPATKPGERGPDAYGNLERNALLIQVRNEINGRALRGRYLPKGFFGEPAWQILLELFVDYAEDPDSHAVPVTDLCVASGEAQTTALRWIAILEDHGLLSRSSDLDDRRRRLVYLSEKGRIIVESYFKGRNFLER